MHPSFIPILLSLIILFCIHLFEYYNPRRYIRYQIDKLKVTLIDWLGGYQVVYTQVHAPTKEKCASVRIRENFELEELESVKHYLIQHIGRAVYPYVDINVFKHWPDHLFESEIEIRAYAKIVDQSDPKSDRMYHDSQLRELHTILRGDQRKKQEQYAKQ